MVLWAVGSMPHGGPIELFLVPASAPRLDYNKGRDVSYRVCGMVHIKDPLLLSEKSSPCSGDSGFPLSLFECPTPYNRK